MSDENSAARVMVPAARVGEVKGALAPRILEAKGLMKSFSAQGGLLSRLLGRSTSGLRALDDVSMHIDAGEVVGLVGESGSGKTTLGRALLRLYSVDAGEVLLDEKNVHTLSASEWKTLQPRYQMIFQNPHSSLNPGMSVWQALNETVSLHLKLTGKEAEERIEDILRVVQLSEKAQSYPRQLSGGEKRRVGLARVLLLKPRLVIADEPTAGLDASLKAGIVQLMMAARGPDLAWLFISHDLHLIRYVSNRILVMFRGRIIEVVAQGAFELGLLHHPYTELLLQSFHLSSGRRHKVSLTPPSPAENLSLLGTEGCCYHPHCSRARLLGDRAEICKRVTPPLTPIGDGGAIACHFV